MQGHNGDRTGSNTYLYQNMLWAKFQPSPSTLLSSLRMLFNAFILLATFVHVGVYATRVTTIPQGGPPVVSLNYATFQGASTSGVETFLGIPFAQPPVGDLRFRRPKPPLPLPGTTLVSYLAFFRAFCWDFFTEIFDCRYRSRPQPTEMLVRNRNTLYLPSRTLTIPC